MLHVLVQIIFIVYFDKQTRLYHSEPISTIYVSAVNYSWSSDII